MMQNLFNFRINYLILLSMFILTTSGCKWLDSEGHYNPSENHELASLIVSEGSLSPSYSAGVRDYSVGVDNSIESIQVTATVVDNFAGFTINGVETASGVTSAAISLAVGANTILVVVTAQNGESRTITITVTRAEPAVASNDATLGSLAISEGDLVPVFTPQTISYGVSVTNAVESVTVTPSSADQNATILVNSIAVSSGAASAAVNLSVGDNVINVTVTAEDGSTEMAYTVTVTRDEPLSANADLSGLSLSSGSLAPTFSPSTLAYTASVAFGTTTMTVTPVLSDSGATVTVNGTTTDSGTASAEIDLLEGENTIALIVLAEDGVASQTYSINVTRQAAASFAQEAYIKASNPEAQESFGSSFWQTNYTLAIAGNTLVVGAPIEASGSTEINGDQSDNSAPKAGAVYIFVRDNQSNWSQQAYLKAGNAEQNDEFGFSVAIDGDILVVGAPEEDGGASGVNGNASDNSIEKSGSAYVFTRTQGIWTQQAYLKASNPGFEDSFGKVVTISNNTIAVGARGEDSNSTGIDGVQNDDAISSGAVYVFTYENNQWGQRAFLKASDASDHDSFGNSVSIDGDTLAVGAYFRGFSHGAVYVFTRSNNVWMEEAMIEGIDSAARFGDSVSLGGDTLVISVPLEDSNAIGINGDDNDQSMNDSGAAYVYIRSGTTWSQEAYIKASNNSSYLHFGRSIAYSQDRLIIGVRIESSASSGLNGDESDGGNDSSQSGAAYFFVRKNGTWTQEVYIKASNPDQFDWFGGSIALNGTIAAVGARGESSSAAGINGDQGNNDLSVSGAVYVFKTE